VTQSGEIVFSLVTQDEINSSPSLLQTDNGPLIVFGSDDGYLYAVLSNGNAIEGWPVYLGDNVGTASFSDLDGDGSSEIIVGVGNELHVLDLDGNYFNSNHFPFQTEFLIKTAPIIVDLDDDNDLEIIVGTSADVVVIDIEEDGGITTGYWNLDRGNEQRTGYYESSLYCGNVYPGDLNCDENIDIFDVIFLVNIILDNIIPSDIEQWSADLNQDMTIDISDVLLMLNIILE
jgi:hypothetical protein